MNVTQNLSSNVRVHLIKVLGVIENTKWIIWETGKGTVRGLLVTRKIIVELKRKTLTTFNLSMLKVGNG